MFQCMSSVPLSEVAHGDGCLPQGRLSKAGQTPQTGGGHHPSNKCELLAHYKNLTIKSHTVPLASSVYCSTSELRTPQEWRLFVALNETLGDAPQGGLLRVGAHSWACEVSIFIFYR